MTCKRHGGNVGSIMCRECDLETIERYAMTTPTPTPRSAAGIKAGCEDRRLDPRHSFGLLYEYTVELERDLAAAKEALRDCAAGLLYIRQMHGELYGVGFDRALGKADAAYPEWRDQK